VRGARRLLISQPALSQQICSLEGELGLQFLERNRRGVRLTPEGAAFLAEATAVVQQDAIVSKASAQSSSPPLGI
jgi:DNA-binding transcriptional LysR family regulator